MKKIIVYTFLLATVAFTVSACSSSKNSKKCGGKRGIMTPMGTM
jgi:hypothetical protein